MIYIFIWKCLCQGSAGVCVHTLHVQPLLALQCTDTILPSTTGTRNPAWKTLQDHPTQPWTQHHTLVTTKPCPGATSVVLCTFPGMGTPPVPREVNAWENMGEAKRQPEPGDAEPRHSLAKVRKFSLVLELLYWASVRWAGGAASFAFCSCIYWENSFYISLLLKKQNPPAMKKSKKPNLLFSVSKKKILLLLFQKKKCFSFVHKSEVFFFIWSVPCVINNFCASVWLGLVMVLR